MAEFIRKIHMMSQDINDRAHWLLLRSNMLESMGLELKGEMNTLDLTFRLAVVKDINEEWFDDIVEEVRKITASQKGLFKEAKEEEGE